MRERLRSPKVCAALVMITWLAAVISLWGFEASGSRGIGDDKSCSADDLQGIGVRLEMAADAQEVDEILYGNPPNQARGDCIRKGETALVAHADSFFPVAYSLFTFALFLLLSRLLHINLFLRVVLLVLGTALALIMGTWDFIENRHLIEVIRLAGQSPLPESAIDAKLPDLHRAAYVKMSALAVSAVVLALLWPLLSRWTVVLKLLGFAAALVLAYGMKEKSPDIVGIGMVAFAAFWLAALIHAIAVAVDPVSQPVQEGGPKS